VFAQSLLNAVHQILLLESTPIVKGERETCRSTASSLRAGPGLERAPS
jgi:hypothetical protein